MRRRELVHEKTRLCIEAVEGPDDIVFVDERIKKVDVINTQIRDLDIQIGAQVVCGECPWR